MTFLSEHKSRPSILRANETILHASLVKQSPVELEVAMRSDVEQPLVVRGTVAKYDMARRYVWMQHSGPTGNEFACYRYSLHIGTKQASWIPVVGDCSKMDIAERLSILQSMTEGLSSRLLAVRHPERVDAYVAELRNQAAILLSKAADAQGRLAADRLQVERLENELYAVELEKLAHLYAQRLGLKAYNVDQVISIMKGRIEKAIQEKGIGQ